MHAAEPGRNPSEKRRSREGKGKEKGSKDCGGQRIMGLKVTEGVCGETGEDGRFPMGEAVRTGKARVQAWP